MEDAVQTLKGTMYILTGWILTSIGIVLVNVGDPSVGGLIGLCGIVSMSVGHAMKYNGINRRVWETIFREKVDA